MKDIVRRVGQRFMVGFEGLAASADVKALIRDFGVGHVILFARNVAAPEQVAELVRELQSVGPRRRARPAAARRRRPGGRARGAAQGALDDLAAARAVGRAGSEETARQMGRGPGRGAHGLRHPLRLRARAWTWTRTRRTP